MLLTVHDIHAKVVERCQGRAGYSPGCERTTRRLIAKLGIHPSQVVKMGKAEVSFWEEGIVDTLVKELGDAQ